MCFCFYSRTKSRERAFNQLFMPRTASTIKRFGSKSIISGYDETGERLPSQVAEEDSEGVRLDDVWDISRVPPIKQLYPTEKPLPLLERIIKASSQPGDVVFDPFCGCGTTIHAAQNLGRRWIGIDVCVQACKVIQKRIEGHFDSLWDDIEFVGMPKTVEDARALAAFDPFKFERWAASLVPGMEANKKQRGDRGIDGRGRLPIRKGEFVDVVAQVKAGNSNPSQVQAFNEARRQAGAESGRIRLALRTQVTNRDA